MRLLTKLPVVPPSVEWKFEMVGFGMVLQQIPRAVSAVPPSEMTLPPPTARELPTCVMAAVSTEGSCDTAMTVLLKRLPLASNV